MISTCWKKIHLNVTPQANELLLNVIFQAKHETVDLNADNSLQVDISDALSEREKVKFTVHTKVSTIGFYYLPPGFSPGREIMK